MKTKLLYLFILISFNCIAQVPTDYIGRYNFENGSLIDEVNGIGNLNEQTGGANNYTITNGWDNTTNSALDVVNMFLYTGAFPQIVQDYSYSFWLNTTTNITNARDIFRRLNNNQNLGFMSSGGITIQLVEGKVKGYVRPVQNGNGGILASAESNVISDGNWHHIVVSVKRVYNSNFVAWEIEVFQDGTSVSSAQTNSYYTSQNPSITTSNQSLWVGNNGQSFTGKIDDIRIFDRGLSPQEVIDTQNDPGVVVFNDLNFKSWFVNNSTINTNGNTEIEFTEAAAFTGSVNTSNLNILDISGIEEFVSITGIDVSDNQITFADFSKNSSLTSVNISNNSLSSLNLKNNNNTSITTYNSLGNPNLLCVAVDNVNFSNTNWTSKDPQTSFSTVCDTSQIYVNINANGANDGTSWLDAYTDLNTAISANPIGVFWVAAGIYKPGNSRTDSFVLNNDLKIYGGFNGTETTRSQRNPNINHTILSGDINGDDTSSIAYSNSTRNENTYNVVSINGNNVVIDGFTITGGYANGVQTNRKEGAGIRFTGNNVSGVKIINCIISGNMGLRGGAAIFGETTGTGNDIIIERTLIRDNLAEFAPIFYNVQNSGSATFTFSNCVMIENVCARVNNTTASNVAGLWVRTQTSGVTNTTIVNTTIASNRSINSPSTSIMIAPTRSQSGSGVFNLQNSIVYNNQGDNNVEFTPVGINTGFNSQTLNFNNSISAVGFSGGSGSGNIIGNPLFIDASMDNYALQSSSPGIDAGNNSYVLSNSMFDYNGNSRIINTTVDIGAYEFDSTLSISEEGLKDISLNVYPNPTNSKINIQTSHSINKIDIYNMLGAKVFSTNQKTIDVSELPTGMYLLKIQTDNNQQITKRFIKN